MNDDDFIKKVLQEREEAKALALARAPKPGTKLRYRGTHEFWFTNIIENAQWELRVGEVYTLKTLEMVSSWTAITLEETGDVEFTLGFFETLSESEVSASG